MGTQANFVLYEEQFHARFTEVLQQNSQVFNGASRNNLVTRLMKGQFEQNTFFTNVSNLINRRDPTSVAAATPSDMNQAEHVGVKLDRRIGPVDQTMDSWRKLGENPELMSIVLGEQVAKAVQVEYVNTAIRSLAAAIPTGTLEVDLSATGTMKTEYLVQGLALFGDAASRVGLWVMHSKNYFDLVIDQITEKLLEITGAVIREGSPVTLNRPVLVTDDPSLVITGAPNNYLTLGLADNAVEIAESQDMVTMTDDITGLENLGRFQGEYAYNVGIKGHAWDTSAGANPTDAALGTAANWNQVMSDVKDTAGIRIRTQ